MRTQPSDDSSGLPNASWILAMIGLTVMAIGYVGLWATPPAWAPAPALDDLVAYSAGALLLGLMWAAGQRAQPPVSSRWMKALEALIAASWAVCLVVGPASVTETWLAGRETGVWWAILASVPASAAYLRFARLADSRAKALAQAHGHLLGPMNYVIILSVPVQMGAENIFLGMAALGAVVIAFGVSLRLDRPAG